MSQTETVTPTSTVVERYFAMWNETDPVRRRAAIESAWSAERASYLDPMFAAEGPDALDALAAGVHEQYPGHRFRLLGSVDTHHDRARWAWDLVDPDGGVTVAGVDYAVLDQDGRLREVIGFFERPTA